jgi:hypothetical protein
MITSKELGFPAILDVDARISRREGLSGKAVCSIFEMNQADRFAYAMKKIVSHQELWVPFQDGELIWFTIVTPPDGEFILPIFPHKELANEYFNKIPVQNVIFSPIPLDDFIDEFVWQLRDDRCFLDILPSHLCLGSVRVDPGHFALSLMATWERHYGVELKVSEDKIDEFKTVSRTYFQIKTTQ